MKKLNKKGFTLIELLAVIAILAILMLLVTPNILEMFNNGRKNAFVTQVQSVWKAAEQKYMSESLGGTASGEYCSSTSVKSGCNNTLDIEATDVQYYVHMNNGSVDTICVLDSNYSYDGDTNPTINLKSTDENIVSAGDNKKLVYSTACTFSAN